MRWNDLEAAWRIRPLWGGGGRGDEDTSALYIYGAAKAASARKCRALRSTAHDLRPEHSEQPSASGTRAILQVAAGGDRSHQAPGCSASGLSDIRVARKRHARRAGGPSAAPSLPRMAVMPLMPRTVHVGVQRRRWLASSSAARPRTPPSSSIALDRSAGVHRSALRPGRML